jgi:hypothetical protein
VCGAQIACHGWKAPSVLLFSIQLAREVLLWSLYPKPVSTLHAATAGAKYQFSGAVEVPLVNVQNHQTSRYPDRIDHFERLFANPRTPHAYGLNTRCPQDVS